MPDICLIAAYDPWVIQLLRVFTEESGFRVVQAFEGKEILPLVQQQKPRVILLEAELPGDPRGRELLDRLKEDAVGCTIPVLIFSWRKQDTRKTQPQDLHVYLQEPIRYDDFVCALRKVGVVCAKKSPTLK
ncbi:MAG: response regulator [Chloroflexota bacterium]